MSLLHDSFTGESPERAKPSLAKGVGIGQAAMGNGIGAAEMVMSAQPEPVDETAP
jgi:hypothetical protein